MEIQPVQNQGNIGQFLNKLSHKGPITSVMETKFLNDLVKVLGVSINIATNASKRAENHFKKAESIPK